MISHSLTDILHSLTQNIDVHDSPAVIECHVVTSSPGPTLGMKMGPVNLMGMRSMGMPGMPTMGTIIKSLRDPLPIPLQMNRSRLPNFCTTRRPQQPESFSSLKIEEINEDETEEEQQQQLPLYPPQKMDRRFIKYENEEERRVPALVRVGESSIKTSSSPSSSSASPTLTALPLPSLSSTKVFQTKTTPYQKWGELQKELYQVPISQVYKTFVELFSK